MSNERPNAPPPLPPSLPPFVKYVLGPAFVGLLWLFLGPAGVVLAGLLWFCWYVYEGYADPSSC